MLPMPGFLFIVFLCCSVNACAQKAPGLGVYYPNGKETQRIGLTPDIPVTPTVKGFREGRDEMLEKAIAVIRKG